MKSIQIIITFEARADSAIQLSEMLAQVRQQLPLVDGCKSVRVLTRQDAPHKFTLVEDWDSSTQHQRHLENVIASGAWEKIAALLVANPVSHVYQDLEV